MSGVVAAMRRNLLSCTSLARHGLIALATALSVASEPAVAGEMTLAQAMSTWFDFNHQEFAVLTTALALLGFSVVAAILLMRTRVRATRTELRLRSNIAGLQDQADRLRALLFAEPQILISWAAGDNRPQISGDTSLLISADAAQNSPQRILAFGTWLPPEPALQMDHAVDALREAGEGFLLNLSTSTGRAVEAMGRAIGGQAIVRIRELGGLRRDLAESNLRYKTLQEETELLRDFAAAAPWPPGDAGVTRLGNDNWIMAYVHLAHDCQIGHNTIFANSSQLAGHVHVGDWAILGGFTGVHQFVRIGAHCMTAIASVLLADLPPFVMCQGQPAVARSMNFEGLRRRGFSVQRIAAVKAMYKSLYRDNLGLEEARTRIQALAQEFPEASADVDLMAAFLGQVPAQRGIVR